MDTYMLRILILIMEIVFVCEIIYNIFYFLHNYIYRQLCYYYIKSKTVMKITLTILSFYY